MEDGETRLNFLGGGLRGGGPVFLHKAKEGGSESFTKGPIGGGRFFS